MWQFLHNTKSKMALWLYNWIYLLYSIYLNWELELIMITIVRQSFFLIHISTFQTETTFEVSF